MPKPMPHGVGLKGALTVAKVGPKQAASEPDSKLLGFVLREGECTVEISESTISVWYSWLRRPKPSTYFVSLAPGLVSDLMRLGEVERVDCDEIFQVGPGNAGTGRYIFNFERKWVRIQCEDERIIIRVRDKQEGLETELPEYAGEVARCERCNGELRTPLAKQCLHCGYDWH